MRSLGASALMTEAPQLSALLESGLPQRHPGKEGFAIPITGF